MFSRNYNGKDYVWLKTGQDQYYLFNYRILGGGKNGVHKAEYFYKKEDNIETYTKVNYLIKIEDYDEASLKNQIHLQKKYLSPAIAVAFDEKSSYIVMENHEADLRKFLRSDNLKYIGSLKYIERIQIIIALLNEVQILERTGIVHRDLKPENICIRQELPRQGDEHRNFHLRIIDFGLSTDKHELRKPIMGEGTLEFLSPDKIPTHATDIYSLMLIIIEILYPFADGFFQKRTKLKPQLETEEDYKNYDIANLPDFDLTLLTDNSRISGLHEYYLQLFRLGLDNNPDNRPLLEQVIQFFCRVYQAIINSFSRSEIFSPSTWVSSNKKMTTEDNNWFSEFFRINKPENKNKTETFAKKTTTTTTVQNILFPQIPEVLKKDAWTDLLDYQDKFADEEGIKEIFQKIKTVNGRKEKRDAIREIGKEKLKPSFWETWCCCFTRPKNETIQKIYEAAANEGTDTIIAASQIKTYMQSYK